MELLPCRLSHVVIDESADRQTVFLEELGGGRHLAIGIGAMEAGAIQRAATKQRFPRPLTHDLLAEIIISCGRTLQAVRIVDMREGTFFAELVLVDPDGDVLRIDCRPSDALALLMRLPSAELLVAASVLADAGQ
jgi:hypothetical protein